MKFTNAIVCDNVRIENNGKHILIGVYTTDIRIVGDLPIMLPLTFWLVAEGYEPGEHSFGMRASIDGEKILDGDIKSIFPVEDARIPIVLPDVPIHVKQSGMLRFEIRDNKSKTWKHVLYMPILVSPPQPIS